MKKIFIYSLALLWFFVNKTYSQENSLITAEHLILTDTLRNRIVPIAEYKNINRPDSTQIVIINPGYGEEPTAYSFIANKLASLGYYVVSIDHDLEDDEPLARDGNLYELRLPVWERGVKNIQLVLKEISKQDKHYLNQKIILIGHSNGGDIAMLFTKKYPEQVKTAITLDHRRFPIPGIKDLKILSIRADEFPADKGVIPHSDVLFNYPIKIVSLQNVKHNDLTDKGSKELKERIKKEIINILMEKIR